MRGAGAPLCVEVISCAPWKDFFSDSHNRTLFDTDKEMMLVRIGIEIERKLVLLDHGDSLPNGRLYGAVLLAVWLTEELSHRKLPKRS